MERVEGGASGADATLAPEAPPTARRRSPRDFDAKPLWARAFVISAGVIMNVVCAFVLYTAVVAVWGVPEPKGTRIGVVDARVLPAGTESLASLPVGSEVVRVGDRAVSSWSEVGDALMGAPAGAIEVVTANPAATVSVELPADASVRAKAASAIHAWFEPKVGAINPGSPAERGGLVADDRILRVDGAPVNNWDEFVDVIQSSAGRELTLSVEREGRPLDLRVTPQAEEAPDPVTGETRTVGRIGILPAVEEIAYRKVGFGRAIAYGATQTVGTATLIFDFLGKLVTREVPANSVGSIVTIGEASGQAVKAGLDSFLSFIALFSVNLAVLNILPIPVLDGGHLLFLAIEGIRGRALSIEQRVRWSNVGLVILMGIMVFALYNDVIRKLRQLFPAVF